MSELGPTLARWALYGAIALLVGTACLHTVVLGRSTSPGPELKAAVRRSAAGWAIAAALVLLLSLGVILYTQLSAFRDPFEPVASELRLLLTATLWGRIWTLQAGAAVLTVLAYAVARRRPTGGLPWTIAGFTALFVGALPAFSGHSFGVSELRTMTVFLDVLHTWAAGAWIGTLLMVFVSARRHLSEAREPRGTLALWVETFSPLALASFAILGLSGLFATWLHVGSWSLLLGSGYGRVLLIKLALIVAVVLLGAYNWRRVTPRLSEDEGRRHFMAVSVPAELVLGWAVLLATALLVATSLPAEMP